MTISTSLYTKSNGKSQDDAKFSFWPCLESICITKDFETDSTISREYVVSVTTLDGTKLPAYNFKSLKNISYFDTWNQCVDAGLYTTDRRTLELSLQKQAAAVYNNQIYSCKRTGYYTNGFIYGKNHVIPKSSNSNNGYEFDSDMPEFSLGNYDRNKDNSVLLHFLADLITLEPGVTEVLFLTRLMAVIRPLFDISGHPFKSYVNIYGKSGVGKSSLAELFFVQNPDQRLHFKSVKKIPLAGAVKRFNCHSLLVDDFHPEKRNSSASRQLEFLDQIARYADDSNCALLAVTAEYLDGSYSMQDRMIMVKMHHRITNWRKFNELKQTSHLLCGILFDFAKVMYSDTERSCKLINEIYHELTPHQSKHRISNSIMLLKVCSKLFFHTCLNHNEQQLLLDCMQIEDFDTHMGQALNIIEKMQLPHMDRIDELEHGIDWAFKLYEMIYTDMLFQRCYTPEQYLEKSSNAFCILEYQDKIYVSGKDLEDIITSYYCNKISILPVISFLSQKNLLHEDASGTYKIKVAKLGKKYFYVIQKSKLELYYKIKK